MLKMFFIFNMIQKQADFKETLEMSGTVIIHTLTYTMFHVTELLFIITGPQIIKNEVLEEKLQ